MKALDPFQSTLALFVEFALAGKLGSFDPTDLQRLRDAKKEMAVEQSTATAIDITVKGDAKTDEPTSKPTAVPPVVPPVPPVSPAQGEAPKAPVVPKT